MRRPTPRAVLGRVFFYGVALFVGLPLAFSQSLVGTLRQPTSRPAGGYEEAWLHADGLRLRAWARPGSAERAAVVVAHGVGDSLESFLDTASTLNRRGHAVILFDFRGHGGSEGRLTTLGGREREDVRAAAGWLRGRGRAGRGLIFFGHSMGAVAVLRAAAEEPDVRAVVAEAPYDTYRETVAHHARLYFHVPRWPLVPLTIAVAEWRAGFDADEVDAVAAARRLRAPALFVADGADRRMPEPVVRRVYEAHPGPKRLWVAPGADHVGACLDPAYWPTVLGFLEENGL